MARITESGEVQAELDFYAYASRVSLDVIASAGSSIVSIPHLLTTDHANQGFGYETDAIEKGHNSELARSFGELSNSGQPNLLRMLVYFFPVLSYLGKYRLNIQIVNRCALA